MIIFNCCRDFEGALSDDAYANTEPGDNQNAFTFEFLSDYEENLPEYFDPKQVKRENLNNWKLCAAKFSLMGKSKHHCRKCGATGIIHYIITLYSMR